MRRCAGEILQFLDKGEGAQGEKDKLVQDYARIYRAMR